MGQEINNNVTDYLKKNNISLLADLNYTSVLNY